MMGSEGELILNLAGVWLKVESVNRDKLAQWIAGYEAAPTFDDGRADLSPTITVRMTPQDVAEEKAFMLNYWRKEGIEIPDTDDSFFEYTALRKKALNELIDHRIIYLHGSAISVNGQGCLFIAPSGTGKSTHARLWRERYGSEVVMINDDKPFVRFADDNIYLCGNPWNGKHGLGSQTEAPLRAIVRLRRAAENRIEPLDKAQALKQLYIQTYQFKDRAKMEIVLQLLARILEKVPCYTLHCNMDPSAAEVAREGINMVPGTGARHQWKVKRIQEGDYGCEERPENEKIKVLVTLENEAGNIKQLMVEDDWLYAEGIDEGDFWPEVPGTGARHLR